MERRDNESITEFTIRRIRAEVIEECAKMVEEAPTLPFITIPDVESINVFRRYVACRIREMD